MRQRGVAISTSLFLLSCLWAVVGANVPPIPIPVVLIEVIDGDTLEIRLHGRVERLRLIGVNTEERYAIAPCGRRWAQVAKETLTRLVADGSLRLVHDVVRRDQYGRMLGYLYAGEVFVNEAMLAQGLAIVSGAGKNKAHRHTLIAAQARAKQAMVGMWGD